MRWFELLPLVVVALLVFGPKRLPEMGSSIGKTIREFQKSMREVTGALDPSSISASQAGRAEPALPPAQTAQPAQVAQSEPAAQPVSAATGAEPGADS